MERVVQKQQQQQQQSKKKKKMAQASTARQKKEEAPGMEPSAACSIPLVLFLRSFHFNPSAAGDGATPQTGGEDFGTLSLLPSLILQFSYTTLLVLRLSLSKRLRRLLVVVARRASDGADTTSFSPSYSNGGGKKR